MRLVAFLTDPFSIRRVLTRAPREAWSGEPSRPLEIHPARGPPELELDAGAGSEMDQTPGFDPVGPEPIPELGMDQTHSW